ncbi:MAG: T9SS type A sorting domain-containing protein, partial [Bacteroidota bacterium]
NTIIPNLIQLGVLSNWISIYAGNESTFVVKSDSTLWAIGKNYNGELGDGTYTSKNFMVKIGTDNNWGIIVPGFDHTIALKPNNTIWGWGNISVNPPVGGWYYFENIPTQINDCGNITLINDIEESKYLIYPNPTSEVLHLKTDNNQSIESIIVVDVTGRVIDERKINTTELNVHNLEPGVYFVRFLIEGQIYQTKFIKERSAR